jgi:hypothetical protein
VHSNVIVHGKLSEVGREVDVQLVDPNQYDFVAFECKDHTRPIDIPFIEAFSTKLTDIGATRGAMVSNSGFTDGALKMASKLGIDTLALVDTGDSAVRTRVAATTLVRDLYVQGIFVGLADNVTQPTNADELILIKKQGREQAASRVVQEAWRAHRIPHTRGDHQLPLAKWDFRAWRAPESRGAIPGLDIWVRIAERCHVGGLSIRDSEGLYNVHTSSYETKSFITEGLGPNTVDDWTELTSEEADAVENAGGVSIAIGVSSVAGSTVERRVEG